MIRFFASFALVTGLVLVACSSSPDEAAHAQDVDAASDAGLPDAPVTADAAPDAVSDAAEAGDPHAPYPGPHPSMPQMTDHGGRVIHDMVIHTVTWAGDSQRAFVEDFDDHIGSTDWWRAVHEEYGIHAATAGQHLVLTDPPATDLNDSDIQAWLPARIADGTLPMPTDQGVFVLYYPASTSITLGDTQSCNGFGGYHNWTLGTDADGGTFEIVYAVVPRCGGSNSLTRTGSHELNEVATDPLPGIFNTGALRFDDYSPWNPAGGESADLCEFFDSTTENGWRLSRGWSNQNAALGKQPCVPVPPDPDGNPYFNAGLTNEIPTASAGDTLDIDVQCYSFAPLTQPMTLDAQPFSQAGFQFTFEPPTCWNGETSKMTIDVPSSVTSGTDYHYFVTVSESQNSQHGWFGLVHVN